MKIYLIGLPLSGKTTISKELSKIYNLELIDLDEKFVEKFFNISQYIKKYGKDKFRYEETIILKKYLDYDNCIISTGGGIVENIVNKKYLNNYIIYLNISYDTFIKRIKNSNIENRPLLVNYDKLYNDRLPKYKEFCNIEVDNNLDINTCINKIKEIIK